MYKAEDLAKEFYPFIGLSEPTQKALLDILNSLENLQTREKKDFNHIFAKHIKHVNQDFLRFLTKYAIRKDNKELLEFIRNEMTFELEAPKEILEVIIENKRMNFLEYYLENPRKHDFSKYEAYIILLCGKFKWFHSLIPKHCD